MPIQCNWDNPEHSIVKLVFEAPVTWKDYHDAVKVASDMALTVPHRVDFFFDAQNTPLPPGNAFMHFNQAIRSVPPNVGIFTGYITNPLAFAVLGTLAKISTRGRLVMARTSEEAYALIHKVQADSKYKS
jgi:hypothetical protein